MILQAWKTIENYILQLPRNGGQDVSAIVLLTCEMPS